MSDCPECTAASIGLHHIFNKDCDGCNARAVARSLPFHESRKAGRLTEEYSAMLTATGLKHTAVKTVASEDFMTKGKK